ncbi:MAG: carbamoyltransferase HypF, partial [Candidatus Edwardsbacteria bacterium]|nr:carbamoyltransferase HypF [Candidatus Edwardsbacteria bacterium]
MKSVQIHINGIVQGVGFRPFIYRLALRHGIRGWALNSSAGVEIAAEGSDDAVRSFIEAIPREIPPQAVIDSLLFADAEPGHYPGFRIGESSADSGVTRISPDIALCADCLREINDPGDRRYRYPFINCTNCGPRFSIIERTPYDRPLTSMKTFAMCPDCRKEYDDPGDRRFHAQPNACPACGPQVALYDKDRALLASGDASVSKAAELLLAGGIVAIKGIGGFHLACDAANEDAVVLLRTRKNRPDKPFAVMAADLADARSVCEVSDDEATMLGSAQAPIVLLKKSEIGNRKSEIISEKVAPQNNHLGLMLPYAPLHHLLFDELKSRRPGLMALVMTSANTQGQPIVADDGQAFAQLPGFADFFLTNDRGIVNRNDDSIVFVDNLEKQKAESRRQNNQDPLSNDNQPVVQIVRHSRGYAPNPIRLPLKVRPALAVGGEMKNCFALGCGDRAFVSQYIGEMDNLETLAFFEEMAKKYRSWFGIEPGLIVHDRHPDYLSTRWALEQNGVETMAVQHHRAHILSVLADNMITEPVIGVAFDGTGYGDDGAIWGGEFFIADANGCKADENGLVRAGHLEYLPLPGGEASIKKPYRIAAAYSKYLLGSIPEKLFAEDLHPELSVIARQSDANVNTVMTSSLGRLFDAVSALLGVRGTITFEAQAAIALEHCCDRSVADRYPYAIEDGIIRLAPMWERLVADRKNGATAAVCSARFHNTIIDFTSAMCDNIKFQTG